MSVEDYRRLTADRTAFWENFEKFRLEHDVEKLAIEPSEWIEGVRATSQSRDFGW